MTPWIGFKMAGDISPPDHIQTASDRMQSISEALRTAADPKGGIKRRQLVNICREKLAWPASAEPRRTSFADDELNLIRETDRLAASVQAGRAWMNRGALRAVLAAAAAPTVDWLILVVPILYKGSAQFGKIRDELGALSETSRITLDLEAVSIVGY